MIKRRNFFILDSQLSDGYSSKHDGHCQKYFHETFGAKFKKATKAKPIRSALVKEDEEHAQHWRCAYASSMAEVFKPPSAGRS